MAIPALFTSPCGSAPTTRVALAICAASVTSNSSGSMPSSRRAWAPSGVRTPNPPPRPCEPADARTADPGRGSGDDDCSQSARPFARSSPSARSDFQAHASPIPSRIRGAFVNWISR